MKLAVVTGLYGDIDTLRTPPEQTVEAEWVCVTDHARAAEGWRYVVEPRDHLHPRLAAKVPKCHPDWYADADVWVWLDAGAVIKSPDFLGMLLAAPGPLAQWLHPDRLLLTDEATAATRIKKYEDQRLHRQVSHALAAGHPDDWGLWATGCMVWHQPPGPLGDAWLAEQLRWSVQDQLSWPVVLRRFGVRPTSLPGNLWENAWVRWQAHL